MAKIKILFDATVLGESVHANNNNSGILIVSENILSALITHSESDITLFCKKRATQGLKKYLLSNQRYNQCSVLLEEFCLLDYPERFMIYLNSIYSRKKSSKYNPLRLIPSLLGIATKAISHMDYFLPAKKQYANFEVFFSTCHAFPRWTKKTSMKRYLILYDTIPLDLSAYAFHLKGWIGHVYKKLSPKDHYFAISQSTKEDFLRHFSFLTPDQITPIQLAADKRMFVRASAEDIATIKQKYMLGDKNQYFIHVSTLESRKNVLFSLVAFKQFLQSNKIENTVFVLGGVNSKLFIEQHQKELQSLLGNNKLKAIGYIPLEDLPILYSGALALVFVSSHEGFGLPVIEAMACGCPVITSNASAMPEVVGDAAIKVGINDLDLLQKSYETIYFDDKFRHNLSQKGLIRSSKFSWKTSADIIIKEFKK